MEKPKRVDRRLDCSGQLCPVPILMTEEKIAEMGQDEVLEVVFTDPGAKPDLLAWCRASGHAFLACEDGRPKSSAFIRKGA
jgi:tRNA 2-thiouridine synthesizing protein A